MKTTVLKAVLCAALAAAGASAFATTTLVQGVRVFDGVSVHEGRSVLLSGGVIQNADFRGKPPAGARLVDGKGRTLLPGLIDSHVHSYRHFELPLLFGVTTQVDMFTAVQVMQEAAKAMASGTNHDRADLFSAGTLVTAKGGHGTEYGMPIPTLDKAEDAQAFVDARIAEGSHFIKIVMEDGFGTTHFHSLDAATVKAAIDAAHKRGKLAVVHISTLANARAALDAGADGLAHLFPGASVSAQGSAELARLAKRKGAFVIPTFSVLEGIASVKPQDVLGDPDAMALLDKEEKGVLRSDFGRPPTPALLAAPKAVTAAMRAAGVPVLAGTDAGNPGTAHGISLHHELASLVDAGLTPGEALAAATSVPARMFRLGKRGRIANGYKADLVLVDGNPLADIGATRRIVAVWKDGEDTAALRARQRERVAAQERPAQSNPLQLPADGRIALVADGKVASPFGIGWRASEDRMMGGSSSATFAARPDGAIVVEAQVASGFAFPFAGLSFIPGAKPMEPVDLGAGTVLRFRVRGDGQRYQVTVFARGMTIPRGVPFTAGADWAEVSVPLADLQGVDPTGINMIGFTAGPQPGAYRFELADVRLLAH